MHRSMLEAASRDSVEHYPRRASFRMAPSPMTWCGLMLVPFMVSALQHALAPSGVVVAKEQKAAACPESSVQHALRFICAVCVKPSLALSDVALRF